jgi:hypothetical protein
MVHECNLEKVASTDHETIVSVRTEFSSDGGNLDVRVIIRPIDQHRGPFRGGDTPTIVPLLEDGTVGRRFLHRMQPSRYNPRRVNLARTRQR